MQYDEKKKFKEISRDLCNGHRSDLLSFFLFFHVLNYLCFPSIHVLLNIFYKSRFYQILSLTDVQSVTLEVFPEFLLCICMCVSWRFVNCSTWRQRRQWHPTPVLLPGKSHGRRSLEGCSSWGCWGSDTTERLHFHFSLSCIGEGNGNPLQCSCLENPRDGGAWWAAIYGVAQSRTLLKWLSSNMEKRSGC